MHAFCIPDLSNHIWLMAIIVRPIFNFSIHTRKFGVSSSRMWDAGLGNGARVASVVGTKCRGTIAGFALLSYPLEVAHLILCYPVSPQIIGLGTSAQSLTGGSSFKHPFTVSMFCFKVQTIQSKLQQSQSSHVKGAP